MKEWPREVTRLESMSITAERKQELIREFQTNSNDVGSSQVQVAVLTERIRNITEHLKQNKKDYASQRGLLKLVGRRSTLLRYLSKNEPDEYKKLIAALGLRR